MSDGPTKGEPRRDDVTVTKHDASYKQMFLGISSMRYACKRRRQELWASFSKSTSSQTKRRMTAEEQDQEPMSYFSSIPRSGTHSAIPVHQPNWPE